MTSKTRLIENVDDNVWLRFAGHCKAKGVKVGVKLTEVLNLYLKNKEV